MEMLSLNELKYLVSGGAIPYNEPKTKQNGKHNNFEELSVLERKYLTLCF